jgi:hypothetical protein
MKLTIEMDLQETERALDAGALVALCQSLKPLEAQRAEMKATVNTKTPKAAPAPTGATQGKPPVEFHKETPEAPTAPAEAPAAAEPAAPDRAPTFYTEAGNNEGGELPGEFKTEYTIEEVRAVLAERQKLLGRDEIKRILASVGETKLTDADPSKYPEMMRQAGV